MEAIDYKLLLKKYIFHIICQAEIPYTDKSLDSNPIFEEAELAELRKVEELFSSDA